MPSIPIAAPNRHIAVTILDALAGVFAWPVFVRVRDQSVARALLHATVNHVRGELARSERLLSTSLLRYETPAVRYGQILDAHVHTSMTRGDVLVIDGIDEEPPNVETIIRLSRVMDTMHASKRPIITIASLANDVASGLLSQLTTRYIGGRPLEWHCALAITDDDSVSGRTRAGRRRGAMARRAPG